MLTIARNKLQALVICTPQEKDETRAYLCGVHFHPAGYAVATNGKWLFVVRIAPFEGEAFTVPRGVLERAVKNAPKDSAPIIERDQITSGSSVEKYSPITERFPDWRRIVPTSYSNEAAQFDDTQIATLRKALAACGGRPKLQPVALTLNGRSAALVHSPADVLAIVMPFDPKKSFEAALHVSQFFAPLEVHCE